MAKKKPQVTMHSYGLYDGWDRGSKDDLLCLGSISSAGSRQPKAPLCFAPSARQTI